MKLAKTFMWGTVDEFTNIKSFATYEIYFILSSTMRKLKRSLFWEWMQLLDDDSDRPVEDSQAASIGASGTQAGQVLRVWSSGPHSPHVFFLPHSTLACLHLVRHCQYGETYARGA